jgi:hypothetical protein
MDEDRQIAQGRERRAEERIARAAAAREAERSRRAERDEDQDREKRHYFAAACLRMGALGGGVVLFFSVFFTWVATIFIVLGLAKLSTLDASPRPERSDPLMYWGSRSWPAFPTTLAVGLIAFTWARRAARRAARRETAWLDGLPFPVAGHLDAFGHSLWKQELAVELQFEASPPPRAELQRLLDIFSPDIAISASGDRLSFRVPHAGRLDAVSNVVFSTTSGSNVAPWKEYTSNRSLLLLFHDLVAEVLLPLDEAAPLAMVNLR